MTMTDAVLTEAVLSDAVDAFAEASCFLMLSGDAVADLKDGLTAAQPILAKAAVDAELSACLAGLGALRAAEPPSADAAHRAGFRAGVEACLAVIRARRSRL